MFGELKRQPRNMLITEEKQLELFSGDKSTESGISPIVTLNTL